MSSILIHLIDGTPGGRIELEPSGSIIKALRVSRDQARDPAFDSVLSHHGIYLYLFPDHTVYVGQASVQSLRDRIFGHHTDGYEQLWSHVVVFACCSDTVNRSEFDYLENALCEYTYGHLSCINRSPSKANCNQTFRSSHYGLTLYARAQCANWSQEIISCLGAFDMGLFPSGEPVLPPSPPPPPPPPPPGQVFYYQSPSRGTDGTAVIEINQGPTGKRRATLKAGSRFSRVVNDSPTFHKQALAVKKKRQELEAAGKLRDLTLVVDVIFTTAHEAIQTLNGASMNANDEWKTETGQTLKEYLDSLGS